MELAAEKLGKKVGGAFRHLISAANKYGLLENKRGQLTTTPLYREYKLAYSDEERLATLRKAFLSVPVFGQLFDRFRGGKVPIEILDKLLIKEFEVDERLASRVAGYFVDAARTTELLDASNTLSGGTDADVAGESDLPSSDSDEDDMDSNPTTRGESHESAQAARVYSVQLRGPGIDSTIRLIDEDDLDILEAMLKKVRRRLAEGESDD